jgi:hypothetical protein
MAAWIMGVGHYHSELPEERLVFHDEGGCAPTGSGFSASTLQKERAVGLIGATSARKDRSRCCATYLRIARPAS